MTKGKERLYQTQTVMKRNLHLAYPAGNGGMVLRTEQDWERDIEPISTSEDGTVWTFQLEADQPFLYFKAILIRDGRRTGPLVRTRCSLWKKDDGWISYPVFFSPNHGKFSELIEFESAILNRVHRIRAYVPCGYYENTLATYPVAFMQDGQNLFFPDEAFMGSDWGVNRTSETLSSMQATDDLVIVGIHSEDRMLSITPSRDMSMRSACTRGSPRRRAPPAHCQASLLPLCVGFFAWWCRLVLRYLAIS